MGHAKVKSVLAGITDNILVRGEIWVAPIVLETMGLPNNAAGIAELAADLGADFCFLSSSGPQPVLRQVIALQEAVAEVHARNLACGVVIDGPWQKLATTNSLGQLLGRLRTSAIHREIEEQTELIHEEFRAWAGVGADMVLLADDLAYMDGLYFSPAIFSRLLLPNYVQFLKTATDLQVPLGFHSDGNLVRLLPTLVETGFSFFSLEPEAMDLEQIQRQFNDRITLMTGIRAAWFNPNCAGRIQTDDILSEISSLALGGRFILSSACGLYDPGSLAALKEIYRGVRVHVD